MSSFDDELRELSLRREEKFQETIKKLSSYIPMIIATGIALWWLFYDSIEIESTELKITERIGLMIVTIILSIIFRGLIANGGYSSAKKTKTFIDSKNSYDKTARSAISKQKQIMAYANDVAEDNLYQCRKINLETNGLAYEDYFNTDGNFIGGDYKHNKKLKYRQKKVIEKAIKLRIILPSIFGYISSKWFGLKKESTQKEHQSKTALFNLIFGVVVSFISVGVTFNFIGISINSLIYAFVQILLWTASGYSQRVKNFNFIIDVLVPLYDEKTHIIESYFALSNKDKEKYEPFEIVKNESEETSDGYK